jgi:hypothetical protein
MTLARRPEVRKRLIYIRRKAMGPPPPDSPAVAAVDDLIRETAIGFDLSPILSGDHRLAQKAAEDFVADLRERIGGDPSITPELLQARLDDLWPWLYRSLNAFRNRLHTAIGGRT